MPEDSQAAPAHPPGMPLFDPARVLRASSLRYGKFRARGVPAILLGVSAIVVAAGTVRALVSAAPQLAEVVRETAKLIEVARADRGDHKRLSA